MVTHFTTKSFKNNARNTEKIAKLGQKMSSSRTQEPVEDSIYFSELQDSPDSISERPTTK